MMKTFVITCYHLILSLLNNRCNLVILQHLQETLFFKEQQQDSYVIDKQSTLTF